MPFGLKNAAQTFQRFIEEVLRRLHFSYAYIDDVLVASSSTEKHIQYLWMVLEPFKQYCLLIKPSKYVLVTTLEFLGHQVSSEGIKPLEEKVKAILDFPLLPSTCKKLCQFLGLINFYHHFVRSCAKLYYLSISY